MRVQSIMVMYLLLGDLCVLVDVEHVDGVIIAFINSNYLSSVLKRWSD